MEAMGMNGVVLVEPADSRDRMMTIDGADNRADEHSLVLHQLLLRLKFLACLTLAFALFPLGVGTGTILYSVPNLPGYLPAALVAGAMCLVHSLIVMGLVSEGRKITAGSQTSCFFRCIMKCLILTTLCTILLVITYIGLSGILGIIECSMNMTKVPHLLHRCGPHRSFFICLSLTNLVTGCVLLTLTLCMSNIIFRRFVKIGLTSKSVTGQVYIRLDHITTPRMTADV